MTNFREREAILEKYRKDPTLKLIDSNVGSDWVWYKFEGPDEDLPKEIRRLIVTIHFSYNGDRVSKGYRKTQKFFCANGPQKGKWLTEADDYVRFNAAQGGNRKFGGKHIAMPSSVLVHLPSIKEPK